MARKRNTCESHWRTAGPTRSVLLRGGSGGGVSLYNCTYCMNVMVKKRETEFRWKEEKYLCRNKFFTRLIILHMLNSLASVIEHTKDSEKCAPTFSEHTHITQLSFRAHCIHAHTVHYTSPVRNGSMQLVYHFSTNTN